jgi:hypothetical protein
MAPNQAVAVNTAPDMLMDVKALNQCQCGVHLLLYEQDHSDVKYIPCRVESSRA